MALKTADELAQELAAAYSDLEASESKADQSAALLHAIVRRLGGSITLDPGEIEDDGEIALGETESGVLVFLPGESAIEA